MYARTHPFGTPTVLSSYEFNDPNAGAPNGGQSFFMLAIHEWSIFLIAYRSLSLWLVI